MSEWEHEAGRQRNRLNREETRGRREVRETREVREERRGKRGARGERVSCAWWVLLRVHRLHS